jgi:hypothetical protein
LTSQIWPLRPGLPCVLGEKNGTDLVFYSLDPVRGKGKQQGKAEVRRLQMDWDVSPDGSRLALIGRAEHYGRVEVLTFSDSAWHEISPQRTLELPFLIAWAADGKGFFVTSWDNNSINLLHVTLAGKVEPLIRNGYRQFMGRLLASPDASIQTNLNVYTRAISEEKRKAASEVAYKLYRFVPAGKLKSA